MPECSGVLQTNSFLSKGCANDAIVQKTLSAFGTFTPGSYQLEYKKVTETK